MALSKKSEIEFTLVENKKISLKKSLVLIHQCKAESHTKSTGNNWRCVCFLIGHWVTILDEGIDKSDKKFYYKGFEGGHPVYFKKESFGQNLNLIHCKRSRKKILLC